MKKKKLNGLLFEQMVKNGLNNLKNHEKEVNELNVFPVPDGDTGSNMRLTVENGVNRSPSNAALGEYLKTLSRGMLLGARGNSGVILSQIFNGFYQELSKKTEAKSQDIAEALVRGYKVAYKAVVKPVEGTILTVAREGAENIRPQVDKDTPPEVLFSMYAAEMKKSLAYTPELLPALKEAGVVDSGAYGYLIIVEGMVRSLYGESVSLKDGEDDIPPQRQEKSGAFNENSEFRYGYELEFVLQTMKGDKYSKMKFERYLDDLKVCGDSIVATQDGSRVKVHMHTFKPARAITFSQEYGEFISFKLENMQLQHNEMEETHSDKPRVPLAKIAVAAGDGFEEIFKGLGCDVVIGGYSMNTSAQEFVTAFRSVNADEIVVFPNDKNVVRAAEQAVDVAGLKNVTVIPTKSPAEGYFALAMDIGDSDDIPYRKNLMAQGAEDINTLSFAVAGKNYASGGVRVREGDYIAVLNGKPVIGSRDFSETVLGGMRAVEGIEDRETCIVFSGAGVDDDACEQLREILEENFPDMEFNFVEGGQTVYSFILGL
ncbi:MAG: DAK2 domain-containing protein [Clostridia bacterium]|nr:DAK2 domain-containing protein [Clostridia bacterium]